MRPIYFNIIVFLFVSVSKSFCQPGWKSPSVNCINIFYYPCEFGNPSHLRELKWYQFMKVSRETKKFYKKNKLEYIDEKNSLVFSLNKMEHIDTIKIKLKTNMGKISLLFVNDNILDNMQPIYFFVFGLPHKSGSYILHLNKVPEKLKSISDRGGFDITPDLWEKIL